MRCVFLPVLLILAVCVSVSLAQTESDKSNAETKAKTEQAENDKGKDKKEKETDKVKARMESVKAKIKARMEAAKTEVEAAKAEVEAAIKDKNAKGEKKPAAEKENAAAEKSQATSTQQEKTPAKTSTVVCFTLRGEYPEGPQSADLFSEMRPTLSQIIDRIDSAAKDKDVAAVWIKFDDLTVGRGKINELRAAIARLRKSGKPVYAELTTADTGQYLVASACNEVIMPESGALMIPGVRAEMIFFKGFLDKIGIQVEDLKMGKYKGALEPFTRRDMSPPLRERSGNLL